MNGFAALDIPPCRRYVVVKATAGFAVCRLILKLLLFYSCLDFTQNLGKTRSNNLNQYAKRANECSKVYAADMEDLRQRLDELIDIGKQILSKLAEL